MRGHTTRAFATLAIGLFLCALTSSSAQAAETHILSNSFGSFNEPLGVAVDNSSNPADPAAGDVYVVDTGSQRVVRFDGSGAPANFSASGSNIVGNVLTGTQSSPFTSPAWAAVDPANGDFYVTDLSAGAVYKFDPTGALITTITAASSGLNVGTVGSFNPGGIAVDPTNGNVWLSNQGYHDSSTYSVYSQIAELDSSGKVIEGAGFIANHNRDCECSSVKGLAVNSAHHVYVTDVEPPTVIEYNSVGEELRTVDLNGPTAVAVDPSNDHAFVAETSPKRVIKEFDPSGNVIDSFGLNSFGTSYGLAVDASHSVYITDHSGGSAVSKFSLSTPPSVTTSTADDVTSVAARLNGSVDPAGNGEVTSCYFEYGATQSYGSGHIPCEQSTPFSSSTAVSAKISGLAFSTTYHFRVFAANASANSTNFGGDETLTTSPAGLPEIGTGNATAVTRVSAVANGVVDPAGGPDVTECYFEWGTNTSYSLPKLPCEQSSPFSGNVTAEFPTLSPAATYHYRLVAANINGPNQGQDDTVTTEAEPPALSALTVTEVRSDLALLHAKINPNKAVTTYHFEYVDDEKFQADQPDGFAEATILPIPDGEAGTGPTAIPVIQRTGLLTAGTKYHFRVVATNSGGSSIAEHVFSTYSTGLSTDPCSNAHVRQQTGAVQLLDCRAYELVSAANTGGYDVESNLVAGQTPFGGYPQASGASGPSRLLYGIHFGGIPGVGDPTNKGVDPYTATRGENSWNTSYVGIPASGTPSTSPFASILTEADPSLDTFAFGGEDICSPCFADGSSGTPIHLPDGSLVQGMAGSLSPGSSAQLAGYIGKHFSADGTHFVFGSTSQFEPGGNSNGDISIYDRNLSTGQTHVVSKTPGEATMTGNGIAELDISSNGSRVVIGQLVSTDADGNHYYHLYMNIGDSSKTIDLTPGATDGVLYDGMSSDGSKVFFTTADPLTTTSNQDIDTSADIYQAEVGGSGATLTRISTGIGAGNTDGCNPTDNWNTVSGGPNCNSVAIGGGGGVSSGNGTVYLLSPELLDGSLNGAQNEPNLYVSRPGAVPHFVTTLETSATAPAPEVTVHSFLRSLGPVSGAKGIAANQGSNDVYATDPGNFRVERFDLAGKLISVFGKGVDKTTGGDVCTVASHDICQPGTQGVAPGEFSEPDFIAVDNALDASAGDVYVGDNGDGVISKFDAEGNLITSWGTEGQLSGATAPAGPFGGSFAGMAVGTDGELFVANNAYGLFRFAQDSSFIFESSFGPAVTKNGLAVNHEGSIFFVGGGGAIVEVSSTGSTVNHEFAPGPASGIAIDTSGNFAVSYSDQAVLYDSSGNPVEKGIGKGHISAGSGVAADGQGDIYVADNGSGEVAEFGSPSAGENPAVTDSVREAGTRRTADFQVNPGGEAVFGTALALKVGYNNNGHSEIYRYDPVSEALDCVSCNPTNGDAAGNSTLASNGLSLSNDGRVFFNSSDSLAARDEDNKEDVYEWENGKVGLISTGTSTFDAKLLSASTDATDAFFFTRDTLVTQDENGTLAKLYDARELGGFPFIPPPAPCKASDECHGASSQAAPPPNIGTFKGSGGNVSTPKKHHHHHHHHHKSHKKSHKGHRHG